MRLWIELTQEEGQKIFEFVKTFSVDRMQTAVMNVPREDEEKGVQTDICEGTDEPKVTKEMIRAVLTEKKLQGKALKGLFAKFGATNLSGVKEEDYPELLKDAEAV